MERQMGTFPPLDSPIKIKTIGFVNNLWMSFFLQA